MTKFFSQLIDNLKIKYKLIIFTVFPIIAMSYFAITGAIEKKKQLEHHQVSEAFLVIALDFVELVHELQKERGLSNGFIASQGKLFKEDLRSQRQLTNTANQKLHQKLGTSAFKIKDWGLTDEFNQFNGLLKQLPKNRVAVDNLHNVDIIKYYSDLNGNVINLIQAFQGITQDFNLAKQAYAYTELLWIQERAGRERAILNAVFSQGKLSTNQFSQVSSEIATQKLSFEHFFKASPQKYSGLMREKMSQPAFAKTEKLRNAAVNKILRNELLNELLVVIGYGGLIHDFKNQILRSEQKYISRFENQFKAANDIIKRYQLLPGILDEDLQHLRVIQDTILLYREMMLKSIDFKRRGKSIAETDLLIKIDDKPALISIEYLAGGLSKLDARLWWSTTTTRINLMKEVSDELGVDLLGKARENSQASSNKLIQYLWIAVVTYLITFFLGWLLIKRLVGELSQMSSLLRTMSNTQRFDQYLSTSGRDEIGLLASVFNQLVTKYKHSQSKLRYEAEHDNLTSLANRQQFQKRAKKAIRKAVKHSLPGAVMFIDLDRFKPINDTAGHAAGDELLKRISDILMSQIRSRDLIARMGGDEFGVLLEDCPINKAQQIAENMRKEVDELIFIYNDSSFRASLSVGITSFGQFGDKVSNVVDTADLSCQIAKNNGRNQVHTADQNKTEYAKHQQEVSWLPQIEKALITNSFVLFAQEISYLGEQKGNKHYELLIRLQNEDGSILAPGVFLPTAERYDLMPQIDRWVLETAFKSVQPLIDYSVNLSGQSMSDNNLASYIEDLVDKYDVDTQRFTLEITETAAIQNFEQCMQLINRLKAIGFKFSLDDFGSGLSSFSYLKNMPVDFLKIDGSFVKEIATDSTSYAMVKSINEIGKTMGIKTIGEFVEDQNILAKLQEIGVDFGQGYHIHKPEPISQISILESCLI